ncbi:riboflavin synthase subunit alpha [Desulfosarcina ovata subsp. sediminis]|uniref:Riboflavin synthase n=1 Tax=Desulfosarcina ovata subsp. sediminis TaxID=885957 RepID=A0A5K7ZVZ3_9BACT|nr:riboflavin synthase [Desulfosarcina ovata]BBO84419.1 riboflavin synthase subunit alpha [Desulfosarcina ovata subsp. sediminis]
MFTGIIEGLGAIAAIQPTGQGRRMVITSDFDLKGTRIGDSIAVNGACLTAVTLQDRQFSVDVSPETLQRSVLGKIKIGERVNLERALRLSDRLDGHLVSGHIDGMGVLRERKTLANAIIITYAVPASLARYMIEKGSVAVDGTSLTINRCDNNTFDVSIIPHTASLTTIGLKKVGDPVNIETDMIGKYVERFVVGGRSPDSGETDAKGRIDMAFLAKSGFI